MQHTHVEIRGEVLKCDFEDKIRLKVGCCTLSLKTMLHRIIGLQEGGGSSFQRHVKQTKPSVEKIRGEQMNYK